MNKEKKSFKLKARQALSRGEWKKALKWLRRHCLKEPQDLRSRLKVAELLERLGQKEEAVQMFQRVAEGYASDGFILQAISVNKMILRMNPSAKDASERLAHLYSEKMREAKPARRLPSIPLFSDLKEQELQLLFSHVQSKTYPKDALVCREGEAGDSLFVISRGEVAIVKQTPGGKEIRVQNLKDGDLFGEFGFFIDQKRHATVKAMTDCELLEISRQGFREMIKVHPRLHEVLQNLFRERVLDNFLALSPLFSSLTFDERRKVMEQFHLRRVPEGTMLFQEGDPPISFFMVRNGEVEIFTQDGHGKKVRLALLQSGNIFGEIGLLFNKPRMASAKTTQPTKLLEIGQEDFKACLLQIPDRQVKLKAVSLKRLSRTKELLSEKVTQKAREAMV
jgi:cAMP-dependent protein kinase regulator